MLEATLESFELCEIQPVHSEETNFRISWKWAPEMKFTLPSHGRAWLQHRCWRISAAGGSCDDRDEMKPTASRTQRFWVRSQPEMVTTEARHAKYPCKRAIWRWSSRFEPERPKSVLASPILVTTSAKHGRKILAHAGKPPAKELENHVSAELAKIHDWAPDHRERIRPYSECLSCSWEDSHDFLLQKNRKDIKENFKYRPGSLTDDSYSKPVAPCQLSADLVIEHRAGRCAPVLIFMDLALKYICQTLLFVLVRKPVHMCPQHSVSDFFSQMSDYFYH